MRRWVDYQVGGKRDAFILVSENPNCFLSLHRWVDDQVGGKREYGVRFLCGEEQHNDMATLFLSSTHHTIVRLFSMGRVTSVSASYGI